MNCHMYASASVQENLEILRRRGIEIVEPDSGHLACGYAGKGRMPEPEQLFDLCVERLSRRAILAGKRVLVTAGPTREYIDAVRYISNPSSGRMGYACAQAWVLFAIILILTLILFKTSGWVFYSDEGGRNGKVKKRKA